MSNLLKIVLMVFLTTTALLLCVCMLMNIS